MTLYFNGRLVPDHEARISVFDRGFLYGDGLFETLRVTRGQPCFWFEHIERMTAGAGLLRLPLPFAPDDLREAAVTLLARNGIQEGVLRLQVTRGEGPRGYSIRECAHPATVMTTHPLPACARDPRPALNVITATPVLPAGDRLGGVKTCNKLPQILARAEAEVVGAGEALLLNTSGHVVEASGSNVFWIEGGAVLTPPLAAGPLAGITRAQVLRLGAELGWPAREEEGTPARLRRAEGLFLTQSVLGLLPVRTWDGVPVAQSAQVEKLQTAYAALVAATCPADGARR